MLPPRFVDEETGEGYVGHGVGVARRIGRNYPILRSLSSAARGTSIEQRVDDGRVLGTRRHEGSDIAVHDEVRIGAVLQEQRHAAGSVQRVDGRLVAPLE